MTEDEPQGSGCGGIVVLAMLVLAVAGVLFAISREAFILVFWGTAWGLIVWQARKVPGAPKRTPPPALEGAGEQEPQVTLVRDPGHPNRWVALRPSEWLGWTDTEDRDVS